MKKYIPVNERIVFNALKGEFELLPVILLFTIDKNILTDEMPAIVSWEVSNATIVKLNDETVEAVGNKKFHANDLLNIVLQATNDVGEAPPQTLLLDIDRQPPIIKSFKTSVAFAFKGSPFTLTWDVGGAKKIEIDNGIGDVSNVNSKIIAIDRNRQFNLSAENYFGVKVEKKLMVAVYPLSFINEVFIPLPELNLPAISFNQPKFTLGEIPLEQPVLDFRAEIPADTGPRRPRFTSISQLSDKVLFKKKTWCLITLLKSLFKRLTSPKINRKQS